MNDLVKLQPLVSDSLATCASIPLFTHNPETKIIIKKNNPAVKKILGYLITISSPISIF
jgi:hypothetical protein